MSIKMVLVVSSNVRAIGLDVPDGSAEHLIASRILVQFDNGLYECVYKGQAGTSTDEGRAAWVKGTYERFLASESKGRFYNEQIRRQTDVWRVSKLAGGDSPPAVTNSEKSEQPSEEQQKAFEQVLRNMEAIASDHIRPVALGAEGLPPHTFKYGQPSFEGGQAFDPCHSCGLPRKHPLHANADVPPAEGPMKDLMVSQDLTQSPPELTQHPYSEHPVGGSLIHPTAYTCALCGQSRRNSIHLNADISPVEELIEELKTKHGAVEVRLLERVKGPHGFEELPDSVTKLPSKYCGQCGEEYKHPAHNLQEDGTLDPAAHLTPVQNYEGTRRLILTVGLPRSGKSTWARATRLPIVSPDAIRLALHNRAFEQFAEPFVWAQARLMVRALFIAGHETVILDACNVTRARRDEWRGAEWETLCQVFEATQVECKERVLAEMVAARPLPALDRYAMLDTIDRMAANFEPLGEDEARYECVELDMSNLTAEGMLAFAERHRAARQAIEKTGLALDLPAALADNVKSDGKDGQP